MSNYRPTIPDNNCGEQAMKMVLVIALLIMFTSLGCAWLLIENPGDPIYDHTPAAPTITPALSPVQVTP